MRRSSIFVSFLVYFLLVAYFGFRPFRLLPRLFSERQPVALEDARGGRQLRSRLRETGCLTLAARIATDSMDQFGPARIITFSRNTLCRNFTLGQEGDALVFRLRTSSTDPNAVDPHLQVPGIFTSATLRDVAVSYDGAKVRLYLDGVLLSQELALSGNFDGWGRNHLLLTGNEPTGERPWQGSISAFSIYDRVLDPSEIVSLSRGELVPGSVYSFQKGKSPGMRPLRYRNLFVFSDPVFSWTDCIANVVAFIPLAPLMFFAFPSRSRRRHLVWIVVASILVGMMASGTIELSQRWILGRIPCLQDLAYNLLGALLGSLFVWMGVRGFNQGEKA
ncbi:LamG-like jellyroll fold domain-containing protein [Pontiella sp.]|uniref:LamG-like jellyroll fold domain-containing protein n=1 Tax=Pontiella sp. TaxID=2837462 RepID=UPI003569ACA5